MHKCKFKIFKSRTCHAQGERLQSHQRQALRHFRCIPHETCFVLIEIVQGVPVSVLEWLPTQCHVSLFEKHHELSSIFYSPILISSFVRC